MHRIILNTFVQLFQNWILIAVPQWPKHAPAAPKNRENGKISLSLIKSVRFLKGGEQLSRVSFEFKLSEKKIGMNDYFDVFDIVGC